MNKLKSFFIRTALLKKFIFLYTAFFLILSCFSLYNPNHIRTAPVTLKFSAIETHYPFSETLLLRIPNTLRIQWAKGKDFGEVTYQTDVFLTIENLFFYYFVLLIVILFVYSFLCFIYWFQKFDEKFLPLYKKISIFSIINILFLICVFTPIVLYQSDISQFNPSLTYSTLTVFLGTFLLFSFIFIYLLSFINKKYIHLFSIFLSFILFYGLLNTFVFTGNYGAMDHFILENEPVKTTFKSIIQLVCISVFSFIIVVLFFKKIIYCQKIIFFTLLLVTFFHIYQIVMYKNENTLFAKSKNLKNTEDTLFSYSKKQQNVVVFVLDMFSGTHMPELLQQFPQLNRQLDGFILFPNSISSSNATIYSLPSMVAGEYYTIYNMNKRKDNRHEATENAYRSTALSFANEGYQTDFLSYPIIRNRNAFASEKRFTWKDDYKDLLSYFLTHHPTIQEDNQQEAIHYDAQQMIFFGLFKFSPEAFFRVKIYNYMQLIRRRLKTSRYTILNNIATLYSATHRIDTKSTKPTFKFFHSQMTHPPHAIFMNKGQCRYFEEGTTWKQYHGWYSYQHYDTEACALSFMVNYINYLKKENIYDNTQIIIVSDHGADDSIQMPQLKPRKIGADVLFLFKDFNARGNLKTDPRLMSNFDIASIFCDNLKKGCPDVPPHILNHYPKNRKLLHVRPNESFSRHLPNLWLIDRVYQVQGEITQPNNWKDISPAGIANAGEYALN